MPCQDQLLRLAFGDRGTRCRGDRGHGGVKRAANCLLHHPLPHPSTEPVVVKVQPRIQRRQSLGTAGPNPIAADCHVPEHGFQRAGGRPVMVPRDTISSNDVTQDLQRSALVEPGLVEQAKYLPAVGNHQALNGRVVRRERERRAKPDHELREGGSGLAVEGGGGCVGIGGHGSVSWRFGWFQPRIYPGDRLLSREMLTNMLILHDLFVVGSQPHPNQLGVAHFRRRSSRLLPEPRLLGICVA